MSNITIFEEPSNMMTVKRESRLADKIGSGTTLRRIATNTNGTFKRIVNGEQIGKAAPHELNIIVVDMLKEVSREYYASDYDPEGKATLPDCWSADGRAPDPKASNRQGASCASCPMNIDGSGNKGRGKACRFKRRIAVLVEGDPTGDIYQMSLAAKSLFGKGTGNEHPFESYCNFLKANGEAPDTVVTKVMYDTEADTLTLKFKAVRHLTQGEADLVDAAFASGEAARYVKLTTAEADNVTAKPAQVAKAIEAPKVSVFDAPEEEAVETEEPVKRAVKKPVAAVEVPAEDKDLASLLDDWADED
jgi:hypothetical protein